MISRTLLLFALTCSSLSAQVIPVTNWFADVSFIWGQAIMDNLEYCSSNNAVTTSNDVVANLKIHDLDYKWNPGVRASIGYTPPCTNVTFLATGTYYQTTGKAHHNNPLVFSSTDTEFASPLWNPAFMGTVSKHSQAKWKLKFGTLDLLARANIDPYACGIQIQPNFGLRAVWIDQHYAAIYRNGLFSASTAIPIALSKTEPHSRFTGVGIKAGTDLQIPLFAQVQLLGSLGGSIVYGQSKLDGGLFASQINNSRPGTITASLKETKFRIRYDVESEIGLSYATMWQQFLLNFSASYFFAVWFDQNDFTGIVFTGDEFFFQGGPSTAFLTLERKLGNLQLQGFVIKAQAAF